MTRSQGNRATLLLPRGHAHKHGKKICIWCVANTLGFPLEHLLWEKVPLFAAVTHLLGL